MARLTMLLHFGHCNMHKGLGIIALSSGFMVGKCATMHTSKQLFQCMPASYLCVHPTQDNANAKAAGDMMEGTLQRSQAKAQK